MKASPLYPGGLQPTAVELEPVPQLTSACTACALHESAQTVCMRAEYVRKNAPGPALAVIGMHPGADEDLAGRPNVGTSGRYLRKLIDTHWPGPVVYDNAIKCKVVGRKVTGKIAQACRPYLARVLAAIAPILDRVLLLGSTAQLGAFGRSCPTMSARRGYVWMPGYDACAYALPHPARLLGNRLLRKRFENDVAWALTQPIPPRGDFSGVTVDASDPQQLARLDDIEGIAAFDCETYGEMHSPDFRLLCVAVAFEQLPGEVFVWDEHTLYGDAKLPQYTLADVLTSGQFMPVAHNAKFDTVALRNTLGINTDLYGDTFLWRKLLAADTEGKLDSCAMLVGRFGMKDEAGVYVEKEKRRLRAEDRANDCYSKHKNYGAYAYAAIPDDVLWRYCARDSQTTLELAQLMEPYLRNAWGGPLWSTWEEIMAPAVWAFGRIEEWGVACSRDAAEVLRGYLDTRIDSARAILDQYGQINWNSHQQLADLLFNKLRLPCSCTTDSGKPSTDKKALAKLRGKHPIVDALLEWRKLAKLRGTYVDGLIPYIRDNGRIHPDFDLTGAATGRLSCRTPNLQNQPRADTVEGKMVRDLFVAPPGYVLMEADYSQLELRIASLLSGDTAMQDIFRAGLDYHLRTAQLIAPVFGIDPATVTKEHELRSKAKVVNFSFAYGKGDAQLADDLGCSKDEAAKLREAILGKFPKFAAWRQQCLADAQRTGSAWTYWNGQRARRRPLWGIADPNDGIRGNCERAAYNTPVQGSASDYCLRSIPEIVRWILDSGSKAKLVLTVHDSVLLEVPEAEVAHVAKNVRRIMESWPSGTVPLVVDFKTGQAWGTLGGYSV